MLMRSNERSPPRSTSIRALICPAAAAQNVSALPSTADAAASAVDGRADTFWAAAAGQTSARIEVDLGGLRSFDLISIQEPIALGERATQHHVEAQAGGVWMTIATGTAIGERKLHRTSPVSADRVALVITGARGAPAVSELGVYDTTGGGGAAASP